jgi:hypothetical protein
LREWALGNRTTVRIGGKSMELNIETFGEIMDDLLKENEVNLLVTLPAGTLEATLKDNIGCGPVIRFYILLWALKGGMKEVVEAMPIDAAKIPDILDELFTILKNEVLRED